MINRVFITNRPLGPGRGLGLGVRALVVFWSLIIGHWSSALAFVQETDAEFSTVADFTGTGSPQMAVVDRASGQVRIGHAETDGSVSWTGPYSVGVDDIASVSVAYRGASRLLVATAPWLNRVSLFSLNGALQSEDVPVLGPNVVIEVPLSETATERFVAGRDNDPPAPYRVSFLSFDPSAVDALLALGNPVTFQAGAAAVPAVMARGVTPGNDEFRAYAPIGGHLLVVARLSGLPAGSVWVAAVVPADSTTRLLFYKPGDTLLQTRPVTMTSSGTFEFAAGNDFTLPNPVAQVVPLQIGSQLKLLIVFDDGARAGLYDFDGGSSLQPAQNFTPAAGERFSGLFAFDQSLVLLSAAGGSRTSTKADHHRFNADSGQFERVGGGELPAIQSLGGRANVLLFAQEPFVAPQPGLVASFNAADWTSQVQPIETGFRVQTEKYADQNGGLGNPAPRDVSSPAGARHALVNQFAPDISIFSYAPPLGTSLAGAIPDVGFSPPSGAYPQELLIALTSSDPAATVFYRFEDSNPWQTYSKPIRLASSASIRAFSQRTDGAKSPVRQARYDLTALSRDANGNGLADAWEQRYNQHDPKADPDGDGFDNLAEFLVGTDPLDRASHPPGKSDGLVGYWPADGDANDYAGSNHGSLVGGAGYADGRSGLAFDLPGNGYVSISDAPSLRPTNFTIAAWVDFATSGGPLQVVLSKTVGTGPSDSYALYYGNGLLLGTTGNAGGYAEPVKYSWLPAPGIWHHVAYTFTGTNHSLYVDGALVASSLNSLVPEFDVHQALIGADHENEVAAHFFWGQIDDTMLFDQALTDGQIKNVFETGTAGGLPATAVPLNLEMVRAPQTQKMMLKFSWVDGAAGFVLERVDVLGLPWVPEPAASRVEGDRTVVEVPMDSTVPERFWRLRGQ